MVFRYLLILLLFPLSLFALEDDDDLMILPRDKVVHGDLKIVGKTVEISGTIEGDLYVMASQVYIDGVVKGDVICCTGLLDISGTVERDVRGVCGQAVFGGDIGRNVSVACASLEMATTGHIMGNLLVFTGSCDILGDIDKNVSVFASFLRFSGTIMGKLSAHVGSLRITSKAKVAGGIEYYSNEMARIDSGAVIEGKMVHNPSFIYTMASNGWIKKLKLGSKIAGSLMNFFFTLIMGLILISYFRPKLDKCAEVIHKRSGHSLITGIVVIIVLPVVALVFLISIVGAPFALGIIALNVIGFYSAKIVTLYYVGVRILKRWRFKEHPRRYFVMLLIIYSLLSLLPYIGWIMSVLFMLLGIGAVVTRNLPVTAKKAS